MAKWSGWRRGVVLLQVLLSAPPAVIAGGPELVATWEATGCRVVLEADRDDGILFLRARCPLSGEDAARALSETLPKLRTLGDAPSRYRLLFLGRLVDYPWISEGLARWAASSPEWDPGHARPRREKNVNRFVANALRETGLLAPLAKGLGGERLRVTGVSAEKVLIARVRELPFGPSLRAEGVAVGAWVPYDALVHLRLAPEAGTGSGPE